MDTAVFMPDGKILVFSLDNQHNLTLKEQSCEEKILMTGITSFDCVCAPKGKVELFGTSCGGNLISMTYDDGRVSSRTVMASRKEKNMLHNVNVFLEKGRYHIFYCLESNVRYLVHQIISEEDMFAPEVVDTIDKGFAYDIVKDENSDFHLVYNADGALRYKKYVYSLKKYTDYKILCPAVSRDVSICVCNDLAFVAFSEKVGITDRVYLVNVDGIGVKKHIFTLKSKSRISINSNSESLVCHAEDDFGCYEINSDLKFNLNKPRQLGRNNRILRFHSAENSGNMRKCCFDRKFNPFDGYCDFFNYHKVKTNDFVPKGFEAEDFAKQYREELMKKFMEIQEEDVSHRLKKIEHSLSHLSHLTEKVFEAIRHAEEQSPE